MKQQAIGALSALGVLCAIHSSEAATITAATCNRADVATAVNSSSDGDTVRIPAGTCSWTSELDITKGISIIGAGIDVTILLDNVPKNGSGTSSLIGFNVAQPKTFRMSSLTVKGSTTDPNVYNKGHVKLDGTVRTFRIDHVKITNQQTVGILITGNLLGVIDHCWFSGSYKQGIKIQHPSWGGGSNDYGDGSWAEQLYWGTDKAIYIEDCDFTELAATNMAGAVDGLEGARVVFRHNTLHNQNGTSHGADSGGRDRGWRSGEFYGNTYNFDSNHPAAYVQWIRGGTGVFFNNVVIANWINKMVQASNCRDADAGCGAGSSYTPWGACNGSGPYDQNTPGQSGYRCVDQPGSGTSRAISGVTPATGWIGNASDPIYIWGNTLNGASNNTGSGSSHVQAGRDFISGTPRPGYTPYIYPHPLVSGTSTVTAPSAPTSLRIVGE